MVAENGPPRSGPFHASSRGNVRSETLRAFSFDEMKKIVDRLV
jgi:uncharacterized protein with GYD domain